MTAPTKACVTCGRILDWFEGPAGSGYIHAAQIPNPDHRPVPADLEDVQLQLKCDFCFESNPKWTVTTESFDVPNPLDPRLIHKMGTRWLACEYCADLITRHRWRQLINRVRFAHERIRPSRNFQEGTSRKKMIVDLYDRLQAHLVGQPRPMVPEDLSHQE